MRNRFKSSIFILLSFFLVFSSLNANEPFIFDVTEIEILKNGNQINGYKGGTATSQDGSTISAENFYYNKLTNILEANGNVKYIDGLKDTIITSDKAIYLKNDEKIFTVGNSKAFDKNNSITATNLEYDKIQNIFEANGNVKYIDGLKDTIITSDKATNLKNDEEIFTNGITKGLVEKKYIFDSENVNYKRNISELTSKEKTIVEDDDGNTYELNNFLYNIKSKILKGENVEIITKLENNKVYYKNNALDEPLFFS